MTTNEAREVFASSGLSYRDAMQNLPSLRVGIAKALKAAASEGRALEMTLRRNTKGDKVRQAYLRLDGPYFKDRECVSFNPDGFIGFAGWADSKNVAPILEAFVEWCSQVGSAMKKPI